MNEIPECFYRVSVKALVLNETRDKFLICKDKDDYWDVPGGGLDWGETIQKMLTSEVKKETGLLITEMADRPSYFVTDKSVRFGFWIVNVLYEAKFNSLDFTPSDECVEIRFVSKEDITNLKVFPSVTKLADMFKPENHKK
ncbi:MAG: NUDIX hydrolase [Candidatus Nomurabacteria bacterium]|nr:NUDIX hydrolase [Candidatus Nomurabacteria bacterium]USN87442.1 MAG: NUDIX hydrolase [Candidatus Nomurabacteria bacterium]